MDNTLTARLLAEIERRETDLQGHAYDHTEWDTGVTKCRHPSHRAGYAAYCWRAQVADDVLAYLAALRKVVTEAAEWHHFVLDDDCWYTCPAATEDNDGGECCDDDRRDAGYCDCGLEWRRGRLLLPIAEALGVAP